MDERPTYTYVPPNVTGGGTILSGMLSIRNAIEAVLALGLFVLIKFLIGTIIPWAPLGWAILIIGFIVALLCLVGVGGEPFSVFILNVINFERRRVFVTLRPPMPPKKSEAAKESRIERFLSRKLGLKGKEEKP